MAKKMIQISKKTDDILVTTWDGREVPLEKCKRIGKTNPQYYEINVDCFYVLHPSGYRWTRLNTGKIAYSHESKKYELITTLQNNNELVNGIIDANENKGYFKFNPYTTVVLVDNHLESPENGTLCLNKELANDLGYHEYFGSGLYVKEKDKKRIASLSKIQLYKYKGVNKLNYNADNNNKMFLNIIKEYQQNKKFINISPNTEQAAKLLPYSFGIEYETSNGFIPKQSLSLLGVVPLKDGSLRKENGEEPYEYTTIPLEGAYGLETIKMLSNELNKRCEFDHKCSLHIHLGNLKKRTPEFVIAFYKLCYNLQDEIFSMFPAYKNHPEKYVANFHKNYCQKLPDLNLDQFNFSTIKSPKDAKLMTKEAFDLIYRYMCDGVVSVTDDYYNLSNTVHPKGDIDKWNYMARYHFVNLVPYLFSNKKTIEFRFNV